MLVASAHWDNERKRFRVTRPPADWVSSICIDSGGFTAAKRWGKYPWSVGQYADFIGEVSRDVVLDFAAIMDYACEPSVNREVYRSNKERIKATIRNETECMRVAPDLPWLPVLQGDNQTERAFDIAIRRRIGMLPAGYAGIGSVCGRGRAGAVETILFYRDQLPGIKFHCFGMHIQALDNDFCFDAVKSWDSYGWNWGKGQKDKDRPKEYLRIPGETHSQLCKRLGSLYWQNTIAPRLDRARQGVLL